MSWEISIQRLKHIRDYGCGYTAPNDFVSALETSIITKVWKNLPGGYSFYDAVKYMIKELVEVGEAGQCVSCGSFDGCGCNNKYFYGEGGE